MKSEHFKWVGFLLATSLFGNGGGAWADDASEKSYTLLEKKAQSADLFSFDYGVPASPALALAGLAGSKISPSTSLKPFVLSLPGLIDSGSGVSTVALDVAPAWALGQERSVSVDDYRKNVWERLGFRTRLGVALYRGEESSDAPSDAKPSKIAIGLNTSLLPGSDPLTAQNSGGTYVWDACQKSHAKELDSFWRFATPDAVQLGINDAIDVDIFKRTFSGNLSTEQRERLTDIEERLRTTAKMDVPDRTSMKDKDRLDADQSDLKAFAEQKTPQEIASDKAAAKILDSCRKESSDAAQHSADINLGAGVVWSGDPGRWKNFHDPNPAVWLSAKFPLSFATRQPSDCGDNDRRNVGELLFSCWVFGGSGRYSHGEFDATGNSATPQFKANVAEGWIGLERIDSHSKFAGYYGYLDQAAAYASQSEFSRSGTRWLVSGSYSLGFIQSGLWIEGSYGSANGSSNALKDRTFLLTLSFAPPQIGSGFVDQTSSDTTESATDK